MVVENKYVLLLSDRELEDIQAKLKGTLSELEWGSWKMYRKSVQLIRSQFEKGVYNPEVEAPAWITLELTIPIIRKHLDKVI